MKPIEILREALWDTHEFASQHMPREIGIEDSPVDAKQTLKEMLAAHECEWDHRVVINGWATGCGRGFNNIEGTFCPYCGGVIKEVVK